jgi:hypothetical protein
MSYFKFDAKDLVEGYDSSDSAKTAIQSATNTTASSSRTTCRSERPKAMGPDQLQPQSPDPAVLRILQNKIHLRGKQSTIMDAAQPGMGTTENKQPPYELAVQMHNVLSRSSLSVEQKQKLFACLEWQFECMSCGVVRQPGEFNTTLYLWGGGKDSSGRAVAPHPRLRGGPCRRCVAEAKARGHGGKIMPVDVNLPEACKTTKRYGE